MASKDYRVCCALFNAYIAKVSKSNPNMMLADRREITEGERLTLIAWELNQWVTKNKDSDGFRFKDNDGRTIEVHYVENESQKKEIYQEIKQLAVKDPDYLEAIKQVAKDLSKNAQKSP